MAGPYDEDTQAFLSSLTSEFPAAWAEEGDLSRLSIDSFARRESLIPGRSRGALRLTGEGVRGNLARLDAVGAVCSEFQRLVVAVGAAREGVKQSRGRISESIQRRARLALHASPAPGSVILTIVADADPAEELSPDVSLLDDEPDLLVNQSMDTVLDILSFAVAANPEAEALESMLDDLGPRAASAVSLVAKVLAEEQLAVDLSWAAPLHPTRRVELLTAHARWLSEFVSARRLDESRVTLTGTLRTVSDRRALELEADGEIVYLKLGDETPPLLPDLHVGQAVVVSAYEKVEYKVGGGDTRTYTLLDVTPMGES